MVKKVTKIENGNERHLMEFGSYGNAKKFVSKVFGECEEKTTDATGMIDIYKYNGFEVLVK